MPASDWQDILLGFSLETCLELFLLSGHIWWMVEIILICPLFFSFLSLSLFWFLFVQIKKQLYYWSWFDLSNPPSYMTKTPLPHLLCFPPSHPNPLWRTPPPFFLSRARALRMATFQPVIAVFAWSELLAYAPGVDTSHLWWNLVSGCIQCQLWGPFKYRETFLPSLASITSVSSL